jgi:type IV secretory pathway VirB4 component
MLPFFDHFVFSPKETAILEGMTQHSEPVIMDWWSDLSNANRLIFGPSGQGKSYKAKLDILRLFYVYKNLAQRQQKQEDGFQILIIDPERETNRAPGFSLVESLGGQSIRFSPGSAHRLNPLDLPAVAAASQMEIDMKEDVLKNHIQRLHRILDTMLAYNTDDQQNTLNPQEKSLLDAALYETYRRAGIFADRETHSRPAPLLRDLYDVLLEGICGPDDTDLAPRLRRYTHGSLSGLFSERTNINLNNSCVQFDIKELESELRPVGFMLISQYIWNIAFSSPLPRFLFIDELATIGRYKSGQYFLEEIFQRARKYGVSVTGMTQDAGSLSNTIIANSAMHILLHQNDNTIDRATDLFKLSGREAQHVRSFDKGEALLLAAGKRMIVKFSASPEEDRLITTNRRQIEALEAAAAAQKSGSVS